MEFLHQFADFIIHIDKHLDMIITQYGTLTYAILFLIVFCETGLVITPFLPGDSLLFAIGTFAARGSLDVWTVFFLLISASIIGDNVNYVFGKFLGRKMSLKFPKIIKKEYLEKTHKFYEKYGGKTIVLAKFMPIVRTFAPFVAGIGAMSYFKFLRFNIFGGLLWVSLFVWGGYFFGNMPVVKHNFSLVILMIIILSMLPPIIEIIKARREKVQLVSNE